MKYHQFPCNSFFLSILITSSLILIPTLQVCNFFFLELSQAVVDAGAVPLLVLCIQEPEMPLKRIAASALSDICKHSPEVSSILLAWPLISQQNSGAQLKLFVKPCLGFPLSGSCSVNPLHPNISWHVLHTVFITFPKVLTRRTCLTIKSFYCWWSFPFFSWPLCVIWGWYCKEKFDASHLKGLEG